MVKHKTKVPKPVQWSVPMRIAYRSTVTVMATTAEEAREKAAAVEWIDEGGNNQEMVDWVVVGNPKAEA